MTQSNQHYQSGIAAEHKARLFLEQQGLTFVEKNYRSPHGEIDLIMRTPDCYIFVEVRLRQNPDYGDSAETISLRKQRRLVKTALTYLQKHKLLYKVSSRFDFVGLDNKRKIIWIKDAFQVQYF